MNSLTLCISLLCCVVHSDAAQKYKDGDDVTVYVNKVGPYSNPHETYHYYQLPFCRPKKIVHKSLTLGEVLDGDRMAESLYKIKFNNEQKTEHVCKPYDLGETELKSLLEAVEENYYFEFVIDDIPLRNFVGYLEEEGIFPHTHKAFLYTHHHFILQHNDGHVISAKVELNKEPPILLSDKTAPFQVTFSYSVLWEKTSVSYKDRDKSQDEGFFPRSLEIHWLSVINSTLLVLLLVAFVVLILFRVVRNDLLRYNEPQMSQAEKEEQMDNGWKVIHTDVFRFPKFTTLFCAALGVGVQLLLIVVIILLITSFRIINVHRHGLINSSAIVLYALTSGFASYISGCMYHKMNGTNWVWNINLTSCLFSGCTMLLCRILVPLFLIWFIQNSFFWGYQSTQALPFTTILLLLAIWLCVGYPLCVVGGILGKNFGGKFDAPCRTRNIPREIPSLPWYQSTFIYSTIGGFLSFSAISVELYYIFATMWGAEHEHYTLYGILLVVFVILLLVTACVSVALTYFQLSCEDYHWWWRAVFVGGSTGFFVLIYSFFFYFKRSQLTGVLQTVQYFGYVAVICYGFFLALGSVSFFASLLFVRFIYANVKTD